MKLAFSIFLVLFFSIASAAEHLFTDFEINNQIDLTRPPSSRYYEVAYALDIGDVQAGDIIIVQAEVEFTNDLPYLVSTTSLLTLTNNSSLTPSSQLGARGIKIDRENGPNVDMPLIHHTLHTKVGSIVIPSPDYHYVILWCRATSTAAIWPDTVTIDNGHLSVVKLPAG